MERWVGIIDISITSSSHVFRVAASLLLSPSKTLTVPSLNAIFFNGDRVEHTGDPLIERLSDPSEIARLLVSKFGSGSNVWVVSASRFNDGFAVYRELVPSVDSRGDPKGYDPLGFPASTVIGMILSKSIEKVKSIITSSSMEPAESAIHSPVNRSPTAQPRTVILGFSKGGIVVNQILCELAHLKLESAYNLKEYEFSSQRSHETQYQVCPKTEKDLLCSISEVHYVDVGLNCRGAYLTNHNLINKAIEKMMVNKETVCFVLHGTPRQWCDLKRPWIGEEKDMLLLLLREEASMYEGRLQVCERFYFEGCRPSLRMHFEIIECLEIS